MLSLCSRCCWWQSNESSSSDENTSLATRGRTVCPCHSNTVEKDKSITDEARLRLIVACLIVLVFVIGEIIGGYFSRSLAILTDAVHMLSDFASFLISLFSIWMAKRPPSKRMSFGWHRAEVIGAIGSVLIIWLVTGVLCYEAVMRIVYDDYTIDADVMLITACAGVFVNVFMFMVLHQHNHHHHHHGQHKRRKNTSSNVELQSASSTKATAKPAAADNIKGTSKKSVDINVRAAFIHVVGDLIQSIGVLIAGYIIKFWPQLRIVDPICTFMFSVLVGFTTLTVLRDTMLVIMEGVPTHIDVEEVKTELQSIDNVIQAHDIHVWSLTMSKVSVAAHLTVDSETHSEDVLATAAKLLREKYGFAHSVLQVEKHRDEMSICEPCN